jgi:hypothetical protein
MLEKARAALRQRTYRVDSYADMKARLVSPTTHSGVGGSASASAGGGRAQGTAKDASEEKEAVEAEEKQQQQHGFGESSTVGFYLVPWKCDAAHEAAIKEDCKATIRCYPLEENRTPPAPGVKCFYSGEQATHMAIFARAF